MIQLFAGEFLVSPVPMEMDLNVCSHACSYCFANLNAPHRRADIRRIMRLLSDLPQRRTLEAHLLRQGAPVMISNKVDLLATSNVGIGLPIVETMVQLGIPIQFQTRGGKAEHTNALLAMLDKPAVWYISICQDDDTLRAKLEPGAPSIESRFGLIDRLRSLGHRVVLGLNPLVRDWLPDPAPLLRRAREAGAEGVWMERLHFTYTQVRAMNNRQRSAVGEGLIQAGQKRRAHPTDAEHMKAARETALDLGLEVYGIGQGCESYFFQPYHQTYGAQTFPTNQDFVNLCYRMGLEGQLIPFEVYADCLVPHLPQGTWPIDNYLGSTAHNLWREFAIPPQMSYRQLLSIIWRDQRVKACPARLGCFAWAARWDTNGTPGWISYVDQNGLPFLVFSPAGFTDFYTDVGMLAGHAMMPVEVPAPVAA